MLTLAELEHLVSEKDLNKRDFEVLQLFKKAITDWPEEVDSVDEFVDKVEVFISGETTLKNIREKASEDVMRFAWQAESLSQICDIFNYYPRCKTLRDILNVLKSDPGIQ
jgi:hypothetical protein